MLINFGSQEIFINKSESNVDHLKEKLSKILNIDSDAFYLTQNGRILHDLDNGDSDLRIYVCPRVLGGKGGFGSMLRAIGAQIEKTTNRDACRDLSGRRLRDINEEQKLKRWFEKQGEREEEKKELERKKIEKLKRIQAGPPLPKVDDKEYNDKRAQMADDIYAAVDQGFSTAIETLKSSSSTASATVTSEEVETEGQVEPPKRKAPEEIKKEKPKKMKKLMLDEDFSCSSSEEEPVPTKKLRVSI